MDSPLFMNMFRVSIEESFGAVDEIGSEKKQNFLRAIILDQLIGKELRYLSVLKKLWLLGEKLKTFRECDTIRDFVLRERNEATLDNKEMSPAITIE